MIMYLGDLWVIVLKWIIERRKIKIGNYVKLDDNIRRCSKKKQKKRNWIRCEWDEKEIVLKMV